MEPQSGSEIGPKTMLTHRGGTPYAVPKAASKTTPVSGAPRQHVLDEKTAAKPFNLMSHRCIDRGQTTLRLHAVLSQTDMYFEVGAHN